MKRLVLTEEQKNFIMSHREMSNIQMALIIGINNCSLARFRKELNAECTRKFTHKMTKEIKDYVFEMAKDSDIKYTEIAREVERKFGVKFASENISRLLRKNGLNKNEARGTRNETLEDLFKFNRRMSVIKKLVAPGKKIVSKGRKFEIKAVYSNYVLTTKDTCINYYDIDGVIK